MGHRTSDAFATMTHAELKFRFIDSVRNPIVPSFLAFERGMTGEIKARRVCEGEILGVGVFVFLTLP